MPKVNFPGRKLDIQSRFYFFEKIKTRGLHFSGRKSILGAIRGENGERLTIAKYALRRIPGGFSKIFFARNFFYKSSATPFLHFGY